MPKDNSDTPRPQQVIKPVIKFVIGFIAGACAAFLPRLTAALAVSNGKVNVDLFDAGYIEISMIFALLVGLIVMILEWGVAREPRATFMMAIGVPALITGSMNTTTGVDTITKQAQENQELAVQLEKHAGIPTLPALKLTPISRNDVPDVLHRHYDDTAWLGITGIATAYAGTIPPRATGMQDTAFKVEEPLYYIVLAQADSKEQAKQMVQQLRTAYPQATAVQSGSHYFVLYSNSAFKRADAVLTILKLKNNSTLQPQLMPAQ